MKKETYLGDGLYVSFDGEQFCLRAPRRDGDHKVYFDRHMLVLLIEYTKQQLTKVK